MVQIHTSRDRKYRIGDRHISEALHLLLASKRLQKSGGEYLQERALSQNSHASQSGWMIMMIYIDTSEWSDVYWSHDDG